MKPGFCYVTGQSGYIGVESGVLPYKNTFILDEPVAQPKLLLRISTLKEIKQEVFQFSESVFPLPQFG